MKAVIVYMFVIMAATNAIAGKPRKIRAGAEPSTRVECAAVTFTGTKSSLRFNVDPVTMQPHSARFTFTLRGGRVNVLSFAGEDVAGINIRPGAAGEMEVSGLIRTPDTFNEIALKYEGNDFATRIDPQTRDASRALMNLFLRLSNTGDFGHVSNDPNRDPRTLGGAIAGYALWNHFSEPIRFKNIICAKFF